MAKCIGFNTDWTTRKAVGQQQPTTTAKNDLLSDDTSKGKEFLAKKLEDVTSLVVEIATNFLLMKTTVSPEDMKFNCSEVRDDLMDRLKELHSKTQQVASTITSSTLTQYIKQDYFVTYSSGVIERLQKLLQTLGRLSELQQRIFTGEQHNPFVSDESTLVHSLATVWSVSLNVMNSFKSPSESVFQQDETDLDDYNFTDHLEFSTACQHYAKVFLMDLLTTSWIQFNRLVKFDDLLKSLPFLCHCNCKLFFNTMRLLDDEDRSKFLSQLLPLFVDYQSRPSWITEIPRQHNIVPLEPCYNMTDQQTLAYFVVWNIYSLSKIVKTVDKPMISNCRDLLESSYSIAMKQFEAILSQPGIKLSPHQEERHKLLTHMKFSLDKTGDTPTAAATI